MEAKLAAQLAAAETERTHLTAALAARERTIAETHERGSAEEQRIAELLEAAQLREAERDADRRPARGAGGADRAAAIRGRHP
jgi:hypothetical protein